MKHSWNSNFTIKDLSIKPEHDPLADFPFLNLIGFAMANIYSLVPSQNSCRGIKEIYNTKIEPLIGSLLGGWKDLSFPIPTLNLTYFDRRHTVKTIIDLIEDAKLTFNNYVPIAKYEVVKVEHEPLISSFSERSIMMMAGLRCNVDKGDNDSSSEHFKNSAIGIINAEYDFHPHHELKTKEFIEKLCSYMGVYDRFSNAGGAITKIIDHVYDNVNDVQKNVAGKDTFNLEPTDLDKFITNSNEFKPHNTNDEDTIYRNYPMSLVEYHNRDSITKLLQTIFKEDKDATKEDRDTRLTKVLLWCHKDKKTNAVDYAPNLKKAREKFVSNTNNIYYTMADSVCNNFQKSFPNHYDDEFKILSDYNVEFYYLPQIDGEDESKAIKVDFDERNLNNIFS